MKRWNWTVNKEVEIPYVDDFIEEIIKVYNKHGLSISHEDGHGAFVVEPCSERNINWLRDALCFIEVPIDPISDEGETEVPK